MRCERPGCDQGAALTAKGRQLRYCSVYCKNRVADLRRRRREGQGVPRNWRRWKAGEAAGIFVLIEQLPKSPSNNQMWRARCTVCSTEAVIHPAAKAKRVRGCKTCSSRARVKPRKCRWCQTEDPERFTKAKAACDACDRKRHRNGVCARHGLVLEKALPGSHRKATCPACLRDGAQGKLENTVKALLAELGTREEEIAQFCCKVTEALDAIGRRMQNAERILSKQAGDLAPKIDASIRRSRTCLTEGCGGVAGKSGVCRPCRRALIRQAQAEASVAEKAPACVPASAQPETVHEAYLASKAPEEFTGHLDRLGRAVVS